jgi:hypothetical protein
VVGLVALWMVSGLLVCWEDKVQDRRKRGEERGKGECLIQGQHRVEVVKKRNRRAKVKNEKNNNILF